MAEIPKGGISITEVLRHLEIAEANLVKLEKLWDQIFSLTPTSVCFGAPPEYEDKCRSYSILLPFLTPIDGWRPTAEPWEYDTIAQTRFDYMEIGLDSIGDKVRFDSEIELPGAELRQYRFLLNQKRRQITREIIFQFIEAIDSIIMKTDNVVQKMEQEGKTPVIERSFWDNLNENIRQIDTLLGSTKRPERWGDLMRHKRFAELHDFIDIKVTDWPAIKKGIVSLIYDDNDPIPSEIDDLSLLVGSKATGVVSKELKWGSLDAEKFERLIYTLISQAEGYENPQWLMLTTAPDKGRDLSVERVTKDSLAGVTRKRVIIQCKHWLSKSISVSDIATIHAQMKLWEPPRIDICIIATSGRFTADAVSYIEKENQSDRALIIEMWPESLIESILAKKPNLIADFRLR